MPLLLRASYIHGGGHRWFRLPQGANPGALARAILSSSRFKRPIENDEYQIIGYSTDYMFWRVEWGMVAETPRQTYNPLTLELEKSPRKKAFARDNANRFKLDVYGVEYPPLTGPNDLGDAIPAASVRRFQVLPPTQGSPAYDEIRITWGNPTAYWVVTFDWETNDTDFLGNRFFYGRRDIFTPYGAVNVPNSPTGAGGYQNPFDSPFTTTHGQGAAPNVSRTSVKGTSDVALWVRLWNREAWDEDTREWRLASETFYGLGGNPDGEPEPEEPEDEEPETEAEKEIREEKERREYVKRNGDRDILLLTGGLIVALAGGAVLVESAATALTVGITGQALTATTTVAAGATATTAVEAETMSAAELAEVEYNLERAGDAIGRLTVEVGKHQAAVAELEAGTTTAAEVQAQQAVMQIERQIMQERAQEAVIQTLGRVR